METCLEGGFMCLAERLLSCLPGHIYLLFDKFCSDKETFLFHALFLDDKSSEK